MVRRIDFILENNIYKSKKAIDNLLDSYVWRPFQEANILNRQTPSNTINADENNKTILCV
jgi:hypothetical protein